MDRRSLFLPFFASAWIASFPVTAGTPSHEAPLSEASVDAAVFADLPNRPSPHVVPEIVKAEVLLDRARFSPGVIDGIDGDSFRKAISAYQTQTGLAATGRLDGPVWAKLVAGAPAPLTAYTITAQDAAGPYTPVIPEKFEEQSRLKRLGYRNIREALAERFHMSEPLLKALNPKTGFRTGDRIVVAAVDRPKPTDRVAKVVVDKAGHDVEALTSDGRLVAYYPASIGSTEKPAPTGDYVIRRIAHNPDYTYFPQFHFKGVKSSSAFTIAPGPNNPVGLVWMDLSAAGGYGIHGTSDPTAVGKTQSHGCIRLTNWDALDLAAMVDKDTPVSFGNAPGSIQPREGAALPMPVTLSPLPQPNASAALTKGAAAKGAPAKPAP